MFKKFAYIFGVLCLILIVAWGYLGFKIYARKSKMAQANNAASLDFWDDLKSPFVVPSQIRGVYLTSDTALKDTDKRNKILDMVKTKTINSLVINANDGLSPQDRPKMAALIKQLESNGIYTIARIAVFQNAPLVFAKPQFAIKNSLGGLWQDSGGQYWIDPASREAWQEILLTARMAAGLGFREINFDYIRFPSTGNFKNALYPSYDLKTPKKTVINDFAKFIRDNLKNDNPNLVLSADIFADTLLVADDAGIGQKFTEIVDYFDVTCPMIYPSHYKAGYFGQKNPAAAPYLVVSETLKRAAEKLQKANKKAVIRPWLQDFDIGADYNEEKIRLQIKALGDTGFNHGWLLWNGRNVYTALPAETKTAPK